MMCWLGLHRWIYHGEWIRACSRCEAVQRRAAEGETRRPGWYYTR